MRTKHPSPPAEPALFDAPALPLVPDWVWEQRQWNDGWEWVAGVDEAGRGPLAGPVVAAAVILPRRLALEGGSILDEVRDSKCLSEEQRERLFEQIVSVAECWAVGAAEPEEIDRVNILQATYLAMGRALAGLSRPPHGALVDGLPARGLPCPHRAIVKGDAQCMSIAAASILAKVTRDRRMRDLDTQHPGYGFGRHKGYPTPEHLSALRKLGVTAHHRRTFRPVAELLGGTTGGASSPPRRLL